MSDTLRTRADILRAAHHNGWNHPAHGCPVCEGAEPLTPGKPSPGTAEAIRAAIAAVHKAAAS